MSQPGFVTEHAPVDLAPNAQPTPVGPAPNVQPASISPAPNVQPAPEPPSGGLAAARNVIARFSEPLALVGLPIVLGICAVTGLEQTGVLSLVTSVLALMLFFTGYEWRKPSLRETMPVVVMAALAAAGRILFAPIPHVKPVSAIAIISGAVFGRQSGFMVGALAALVSNFFFGQGAWTPWQMYAFGLVGWVAGVLSSKGAFEHKGAIYGWGFTAGWLYGLILNLWSFMSFYHPQNLTELLIVWAPAIPYDAAHAVSTVAFLFLLWAPWHRKLERLKLMYGLGSPGDEGKPPDEATSGQARPGTDLPVVA